MKRTMLGASATLCALLALPAVASAKPLHIEPTENFSVSGGNSTWTRAAGGGATGTSLTGSGSFENTTTGTLKLTFHHMTSSPVAFNCTSAGQARGTVTSTKLSFHLVTLPGELPGILITFNTTLDANGNPIAGTTHFMDYNCGVFVGTLVWKGTGILGTILHPKCGQSSNTMIVRLGHKEDITGYNPLLESSVGGGAYSPSTITAEATITFGGGATPKLNCT